MATDALAPFKKSITWLAKAGSVADVVTFRDKAAAATHYCQAAKMGIEAYNLAAEAKLRAERRAGELLAESVKAGNPQLSHGETIGLDELGIDRNQSSRWQAIATVSEHNFDLYIDDAKRTGKEIRSSDLIREGRRIKREAKRKAAEPAKPAEPNVDPDASDWRIFRSDVLDGLDRVSQSEERARLIFTDPPYNIGIDYGDGAKADKRSDEDYMTWVGEWLELCRECLTPDGSLWVMIGDEYAAEYGVLLKQLGFTVRNWIKWYETFGVNCQNKFNRTSRHIFYCVRNPKSFVFNRDPVTRPSDRQTKYGDKRAAEGGKLWDDVWEIPRVFGTSTERLPDFPTQLPLRLVRPVVECASDIGDLVIDPFNGSGTTGVAAIETARRYIGIELSEDFAARASVRLANTQTPIMEVLQ